MSLIENGQGVSIKRPDGTRIRVISMGRMIDVRAIAAAPTEGIDYIEPTSAGTLDPTPGSKSLPGSYSPRNRQIGVEKDLKKGPDTSGFPW